MKIKFIRNSIGLLLLGTLLCATDCGSSESVVLTIKNESGKPIKIKSYKDKILQKTIDLRIKEEYSKTYYSIRGSTVLPHEIFGADSGPIIDSLIIVYDNYKKKSWKIKDDYLLDVFDSSTNSFVFKVEDYENAVDCNGACE